MKKLFLGLGLLLLLSSLPLAAVNYPYYTAISDHQTGGPFITAGAPGYNNWETPLNATNTGGSTVNVWFVWTAAWSQDTNGLNTMTWDNTLQQFEYTNLAGAPETAAQMNAAFYLPLDSSSTNIPIPSGFGLSTSDSVPAFWVGTLAPGGSVDWNVDQTLSSNIYTFYFGGSFVATPAPEPASLLLLAGGLLGTIGYTRRRFVR